MIISSPFTKKLPPDEFIAYLKTNYSGITQSTNIFSSSDLRKNVEKTLSVSEGITKEALDLEIANYDGTKCGRNILKSAINKMLKEIDFVFVRDSEEDRLLSLVYITEKTLTQDQLDNWFKYAHDLRALKECEDPDNPVWPLIPNTDGPDTSIEGRLLEIQNG